MANGTYPLWSTLDSPTHVKKIMDVMVKAGSDKTFRDACLGLNGADPRTTIENEAKVKFDDKIVLQCFPDRETVENQIVLLLPKVTTSPTAPVKDYWLCTYVDYIPAKPPGAVPA